MTLPRSNEKLNDEEIAELKALKEAIKYHPHSVSPEKMEILTDLLIRSIEHETV